MAKKSKKEMKQQLFEMNVPVPSIPLHELKFKDGKWTYVYAIETPELLTDKKRKEPLYMVGSLKDMKLGIEHFDMMVNTEIRSKDDMYKLFRAQRKSDLHYRKIFKEENDMSCYKERTFKVQNKDQSAVGKMIVRVKKKTEEETIFVGRG